MGRADFRLSRRGLFVTMATTTTYTISACCPRRNRNSRKMAGVKLSLMWSVDGCDEKIYPHWSEKRPRKPPKKSIEIPPPKIVEVESIQTATLRYQIKTKKESLEATRIHARKLYSQNIALMDKILRIEDKTHMVTDKILGRYEHYKGAIAKLKKKSSESIVQAEKDLETVRATVTSEISALRHKTKTLNNEIEHHTKQLQIMRHYKNNEFPVRMARIEQMKDKMTDEKVEQEEQLAFLQKNIVEKSIQGIKQQSNKEEAKAIEQATMAYLESTKKSVEAKVIQNEVIQKEIRMHQAERNHLIGQIEELKDSIARLKALSQQKVFTKCEPDTELTLDIPIFDPLPI